MKNKLFNSVIFGMIFAVISTQAVEDKSKAQEPDFVYKTMPGNKTLSGNDIKYKVLTESGKKAFVDGYKKTPYPFDIFMYEIEYNVAQFEKRIEKAKREIKQYKVYKFDDNTAGVKLSYEAAVTFEDMAYRNCYNIEVIETILNSLYKDQYVNKMSKSGKLYSSYYDYAAIEAAAPVTYNIYK